MVPIQKVTGSNFVRNNGGPRKENKGGRWTRENFLTTRRKKRQFLRKMVGGGGYYFLGVHGVKDVYKIEQEGHRIENPTAGKF